MTRAVQEQVERTSELVRKERELAGQLREHLLADETLQEDLQSQVESSSAQFHNELAQLRSKTTESVAALRRKVADALKQTEQKVDKFAEDVDFYFTTVHDPNLNLLVEKTNRHIEASQKTVESITEYVTRVHDVVDETRRDVGDLLKSLQELTLLVTRKENVLRLVSDRQLKGVVTLCLKQALSSANLREVMSAYYEEAKKRVADPAAIVQRLPELFDAVEGSLISWRKSDKEIKTEYVRDEVVAVLEDIWKLVVYWQDCCGIERFPNVNEAYDERLHRLRDSHVVPVSTLPDTICEVVRSGYHLGDVRKLLRKAEVVVNVKPKKYDS